LSGTSGGSAPAEAAAAGRDPTIPLAGVEPVSPAAPPGVAATSPANFRSSRADEVSIGDGRILWSPDPIGMNYYLHETERTTRLPEILNLVGPSELLDPGNLPATVGVYLWQSLDGQALHADLVNYNLDLEADRINRVKDLSFQLRLPDCWKSVDIDTITPDGTAPATCVLKGGWLNIRVNRLIHYTCVKISRGGDNASQVD